MTSLNLAQPDVTLLLDMGGIIREATLSSGLADEGVSDWLGRPWGETVPESAEEKVRRIVQDARDSGISAFRQLTQRFPSGRELPIEYTTVLLGGRAGLLAIGKSLQGVAELQSRLIAAQQAMERDYWKLREVETRYRLLFNSSTEAVLLVNAGNHRIFEANPAAVLALGLDAANAEDTIGKDLLAFVPAAEHPALLALFERVREQGKAPGVLIHLGPSGDNWLVRASPMRAESRSLLLLQLVPGNQSRALALPEAGFGFEEVLEGLPDGFVIIDQRGRVTRANRAFADMVEMVSPGAVAGESLERWVWRPGADLSILLAAVREHQTVRLFSTALHGELGSETEVEISAALHGEPDAGLITLVIRDVGRRIGGGFDKNTSPVLQPVGRVPLRLLVKHAVDEVERFYVRAALEQTGGNRTAASELLGLSRQSLYMKLSRYGLDDQPSPDPEEGSSLGGR